MVMKAVWNGKTLAESDASVEIEGNQYFPPSALNREYFEESGHTSECPWKGTAHYYHAIVDGARNKNAAWYYPAPKAGAIERVGTNFTDYVAFWHGVSVSE